MNNDGIIVIKFGGHAMDVPELAAAFMIDLGALINSGARVVLVHGGGPQISRLLEQLGIQSVFRDGLRVTDQPTLTAVEMALCGSVNKRITRDLLASGVKAAGISGEDGATLIGHQKDPQLGLVGEVVGVNPELLKALLEKGFTPVVAPLALDENGVPLNVNADTAAGAIAGALNAQSFILISDVPGVLDATGSLLDSLQRQQIDHLCREGVIHGGMIPKVQACDHALNKGCGRAIILDGREKNGLLRFLREGEPLGTIIH